MNRRQQIGLAAVGFGIILVSIDRKFLPPELDLYAVVAVGFLTVIVGVFYALEVYARTPDRWQPTDPECGLRTPAPGEDLGRYPSGALKYRLRQHAVQALIESGRSREEAKTMVKEGTWTEDRYAAVYLGDESLSDSLTIKIRTIGRGDPIAKRAPERVIAELGRLREDRT